MTMSRTDKISVLQMSSSLFYFSTHNSDMRVVILSECKVKFIVKMQTVLNERTLKL